MISEEKIQSGAALVTKIWNVARFCERFLAEYVPSENISQLSLSPADRWILASLQQLIERSTELFEQYDYAAAKNEVEQFFWRGLADNYLEMVKQRLYGEQSETRTATIWTLYQVLLAILKLFAPFLPYVTDTIYSELFTKSEGEASIHGSRWPEPTGELMDEASEALGEILVELAIQVRRFKSQQSLSLGSDLPNLTIYARDEQTCTALQAALSDLKSITRANQIEFCIQGNQEFEHGYPAYVRFDAEFPA